VGRFARVTFFFCLLLTWVSNQPFMHYLLYLRSLQLIVHLPAFMVPMPVNCLIFLKHLIPIARFDWFRRVDALGALSYSSEDSETKEYLSEDVVHQLMYVDYKEYSTLTNLTTFRFFFYLTLIRVVLYPIVRALQAKFP
jgi:hypothetical protein